MTKIRYRISLVCLLGIFTAQAVHSQDNNVPRAAKPRGSTDWIYDPNPVVACGGAKCSVWRGTWEDGDCRILNATLTMQPDGRVSWSAKVREINPPVFGSNAVCAQLSFLDVNGTPVFSWPKFCSPSLTEDDQDWNRSNLGVPAVHVPAIVRIGRVDTC